MTCFCYVHPLTGKASTRARPQVCPVHRVPPASEVYHCNSAGLIGGFPVCGQPTGLVVADSRYVNCPECLAEMKRQCDQWPLTRWPECAGCRAGIKHIHCRHPWQDEGGGG